MFHGILFISFNFNMDLDYDIGRKIILSCVL